MKKFDHSYFFFWYICICADDRKISGTRTIYGKQFIFSFFPFHIVLIFFPSKLSFDRFIRFFRINQYHKKQHGRSRQFLQFNEWKDLIFLVTLNIYYVILIVHFDLFIYHVRNDAFSFILQRCIRGSTVSRHKSS